MNIFEKILPPGSLRLRVAIFFRSCVDRDYAERRQREKIQYLPSRISEIEKNKMQNLKNKFSGERCFIVGNGPSLNLCDLTLLKDEYSFGVNGVFYKTDEMGFRPTFYVVEDNHVVADNVVEINRYNCQYKFFPAKYRDVIEDGPSTYFFSEDFGFYWGTHPYFCKPRFSTDCSSVIYAGQSVTYMNLQLAYYMGFSKIYLIGMDFSYSVPKSTLVEGMTYTSNEDDPNHFHPEYFGKGKRWHDPKLERVGWNYEFARSIYEAGGRRIFNATVGGELEIFERVEYNELFNL